MGKVTFVSKKIETAPLEIHLVIPPEKPRLRGFITCDSVIRTRAEMKELNEANLNDEDYLRAAVTAIHGLATEAEPTVALEGEAAFAEALTGPNSAFILVAIVEGYNAQYGEARQKNLRTSRGR